MDGQVGLTLGLILLVALIAGRLASVFRLPRVTAYLLIGVAIGPAVLGLVKHAQLEHLKPLTQLAIALVLFTLGCHFPLVRARRIIKRVYFLSRSELIWTFAMVFCGVLLFGAGWKGAVLLGILALATAPATTILVLKEVESEGTITEMINTLVAINNLVSIILFELVFVTLLFLQGGLAENADTGLLLQEFYRFGIDLAGSVTFGAAGGLVISLIFTQTATDRRLILLFAVIMSVLGLCEYYEAPYLLAFLAMGITVANTTDQTDRVLSELDRATGLLCVVFFVAHGAELQLGMLAKAGLLGVVYLVTRLVGKFLGIWGAARRHKEEPGVRNWLGISLLSQAGVAIALSSVAVKRSAEVGGDFAAICREIQTIILGTVVIFEIIGPIFIRLAVLRTGEVPIAHAISHNAYGAMDVVRTVWNRLMLALGMNPWRKQPPEKMTIRHLMRSNQPAVHADATFDDVINLIQQSRNDTYPVVGNAGELLGLIRYRELSNELFDPTLGSLVRADDLMTPSRWVLFPDEPAPRALDLFEKSQDDCLPVVTREKPYQLIGIVRRRDVLRILIRKQIDTGDDTLPNNGASTGDEASPSTSSQNKKNG
jgi:Kef-type K+ transport system membrane component KefB